MRWIFALIFSQIALADGGSVALRQDAGEYVVTVFTSPARVSLGSPVDLSVLVQKKSSLEPVLDAMVSAAFDLAGIEFVAQPSHELARNKLLYAAPIMFARSGKWRIEVAVVRNGNKADVTGIIDVAAAPARVSHAGLLAFPPVIVILFAIRERLKRQMLCGLHLC